MKTGQQDTSLNTLVMDSDVQIVLEFMQSNIPAVRFVAVANAIKAIAPLLWGEYQPEKVQILWLEPPPISACDQHTQSVANV